MLSWQELKTLSILVIVFQWRLVETKPVQGQDRVVYAGLPEHEETEIRLDKGIPYHSKVIDWFEDIKAELGLDFDLKKM